MSEENGQVQEVVESDENEPYRTILELWAAILEPIGSDESRQISPQWATRIIGKYAEIKFADMPLFRDKYFDKAQQLATILSEVIVSESESLNRLSAEEDAMLNGALYRMLLTRWQMQVLTWELAWDTTSPDAAVELAAIAEIHRMFFAPEGLISLLDEIDLQFTDADRETLAGELQALKAEINGS